MREGPVAELFRATEAAPQKEEAETTEHAPTEEPQARTVEHVPSWEESVENVAAPVQEPAPAPPTPPPAPEPELPPAARYALPETAPRIYRAPRGESPSYLARLRAVGVGGAARNGPPRRR